LKILVTGSDTPIGRDLMLAMRQDLEIMGVSQRGIDLTDPERVNELFMRLRPRAVIHTDGMLDADACEREPWQALRQNVLTTQNLVLACLEHDAGFALISTSDVFSGAKKGPYTEWDQPDPQNVLGHSKAAAEMVVRNHLKKFHIVRTQSVFSRNGDDFVRQVLSSAADRRPMEATGDEFMLPTYSADLAGAIARLVRGGTYGTFHITNSGERDGISWHAWARTILRVGGHEGFPIHAVASATLDRPARRPLRVVLGNTFYRLQGFKIRDYEEALVACLSEAPRRPPDVSPTRRERRAIVPESTPPQSTSPSPEA